MVVRLFLMHTNIPNARDHLVSIIKELAAREQKFLDRLKCEHAGLARDDFIWHYLIQSFSTMGRAAGWQGLIGNEHNYQCLTYDVIKALSPEQRLCHIQTICNQANIRMPNRKASFILGCFNRIELLGGLAPTKAQLLAAQGREAKIKFLDDFPGIGQKYARNIMMDVYHEDFHSSIAIDIRIQAISNQLGATFSSYEQHEDFYLEIAQEVGINGWELDRLLFHFRKEIEEKLAAKINT